MMIVAGIKRNGAYYLGKTRIILSPVVEVATAVSARKAEASGLIAEVVAWPGDTVVPVNVGVGLGPWSFPIHSHDFVEIALVPEGSGGFYDSMHESHAKPGDVYVFAPGTVHGIRSAGAFHIWNVQFRPDPSWLPLKRLAELPRYEHLLARPPRDAQLPQVKLAPSEAEFGDLLGLAQRIAAELAARREGYGVVCAAALAEFLVRLARCGEVATSDQVSDMRKMAAVMAHIDANLRERLTLASLSAFAGMSPSTFCRAFRLRVDLPPGEYLLRRRLGRAASLLTSSTASVAEIAAEMGFSDPSYFARQFKRYSGITPGEQRRQSR